MCAPFSPTDTSEPTVSAFDLADAAEHARLMIDAVTEVVRKVAIDDATSAQLGARGAQHANLLRLRFEEGVIALRATFCNALAGTATTYASETDLAEALKARIERNNLSILSTAMRRADAALTADAHARGDAISTALYGTTETAPCADLTREADRFDYGKSAAASASYAPGAYEAGFVSPFAA